MKFLIILLLIACVSGTLAVRLSSYNIDKNAVTVSGISSGSAMANQLHVAYSSVFSGVGLVAGPPYTCSGGSIIASTTTCMSGAMGIIYMPSIYNTIQKYETNGLIDSPTNLYNDKVYIYHGVLDVIISTLVVKKNEEFYSHYINNPSTQMKTVYNYASVHGFITNNYGGSCGILNLATFMNNCNYNQAYDILTTMYGSGLIEPGKNEGPMQNLIEFDQTEFFASSSVMMDPTGYLYVPQNCRNGQQCKLHVALHGCAMAKEKIGSEFAYRAGYNQVADLNNIIILYPQVKSASFTNPNGCWDWWGYTNSNYANKMGLQPQTIKKMVDRILGNL